MTVRSDNCSICAEEFCDDTLQKIALSAVHVTKFKICQKCLKKADPEDDYRSVREMVNTYMGLIDKSK